MKRLGIYAIIIVCLIACRQVKGGGESINTEGFLDKVFPIYSPVSAEFSKIVDAVVVSDSVRFNFNRNENRRYYYKHFNIKNVFLGSFGQNYNSEFDMTKEPDILDYAIQQMSNSEEDRLYYLTQLLDNNQYKYVGLLSHGNEFIPIESKEKLQGYYELYDFGIPLLTADKKRAIVFLDVDCGPLCGDGMCYLLAKRDGKWRVENSEMVYIK